METPETIRNSLQVGEWVTSIDFKDALLPHTNSQSVQEVHAFSHPGSVLPVQSSTLWSVHSSLCALLWRILSSCTRKQVTLKAHHIPGQLNMIADKLSRLGQTIQTEWSLHPEVLYALGGTSHKWTFCHQIQQQTTTVCVTGFGPPGMGSRCTQPVMGKSGPICLPTSSHLGQSGGEVAGLPMQQDHSDCPRVAQHTLVLGPSGNVQSDPSVSAQPAQSGISTIQPDLAQELVKPEPTCLAPRATAIKEQGFSSEAVTARIEAPQRGSTRSIYEAKWTIFTKWCLSNQVDFRGRFH